MRAVLFVLLAAVCARPKSRTGLLAQQSGNSSATARELQTVDADDTFEQFAKSISSAVQELTANVTEGKDYYQAYAADYGLSDLDVEIARVVERAYVSDEFKAMFEQHAAKVVEAAGPYIAACHNVWQAGIMVTTARSTIYTQAMEMLSARRDVLVNAQRRGYRDPAYISRLASECGSPDMILSAHREVVPDLVRQFLTHRVHAARVANAFHDQESDLLREHHHRLIARMHAIALEHFSKSLSTVNGNQERIDDAASNSAETAPNLMARAGGIETADGSARLFADMATIVFMNLVEIVAELDYQICQEDFAEAGVMAVPTTAITSSDNEFWNDMQAAASNVDMITPLLRRALSFASNANAFAKTVALVAYKADMTDFDRLRMASRLNAIHGKCDELGATMSFAESRLIAQLVSQRVIVASPELCASKGNAPFASALEPPSGPEDVVARSSH